MRRVISIIGMVILCLGFISCEKTQSGEMASKEKIIVDTNISKNLKFSHTMVLKKANQFRVDYYEEGYKLLTVYEDAQYLIVPEGKEQPRDLSSSIIVLKQPISNIYLVASATMDMFVSVDGLASVRLSGTQKEGWYIEEAKTAMEKGEIVYAGKYATPDYELILENKCQLAIENTMVYHTPKVKEELEKVGIPVLVDYSSYECEPLGRTEWVKFYGALLNKEDKAEQAFCEQEKLCKQSESKEKNKGKVAFFYISSNGTVNVRKSSDYIPKMLSMAGGEYVFSNLGEEEENASSSVTLQMEEFYATAKDADYFIYNSTIEAEIRSLDEFVRLSPLLKNCKAVKTGKVFGTTKNMYQASMEVGTIISDFSKMLAGEDDMKYIYRL